MLLAIGRVKSPEAIFKVVNGWLRLPILDGRSLTKEALAADVGEIVDLSQPMDGAVMLGLATGRPSVMSAVSVAVKSIDGAKEKLAASGFRLTQRENGQWLVEQDVKEEDEDGGGRPGRRPRREPEPKTCMLAPAAPSGARLVCGSLGALDNLGPWLTRTAPRKSYPTDVHAELRPLAVREPLLALKPTIPALVRSMAGNVTPAERDLIDASVAELTDLATDVDKVVVDATFEADGMSVTSRVDHGKASSVTAQLAVAHPERAEAPPAAFWHLPAETDLAAYGRGSDPKLLERPRQLAAAYVGEALSSASMPEADRRAVQDLFEKRMLPLFVGAVVYGKGTNDAGIRREVDALAKAQGDAVTNAKNRVFAQAFGWHLARVEEPVSKVAPVLREWAQIWARPSFAKWNKKDSPFANVQVKVTPVPAGLKLPKDTAHLEVVLKRQEPPKPKGAKAAKTVALEPAVFHVFAVPDSGATWLGFGLDGKLVGERAAAVLPGAPEKDTLAGVTSFQGLRETKANSAVVMTLHAFTAMAFLDNPTSPRASKLLSTTPTPIPLLVRAEGPSEGAGAGASVATFRLPKAAIEEMLRVFM